MLQSRPSGHVTATRGILRPQRAHGFPVVDVKVEAVMPENPPPEVHAHFEATLPEVKAPDVRVDVTNNVPPAEVNVHLPARRIESDVKRDRDRNLLHVTQIETDLVGDGNAKGHRNLQ